MAVTNGTDHFIQEKAEVQEAEATITFGKKTALTRFTPQDGNILLTGFTGSKRNELAELLSKKLEMEVVAPEKIESLDELKTLCAKKGQIIIVPQSTMRISTVCNALREHGKVFYLMTELLHLAHNAGLTPEQGREQMGQDFIDLEPQMLASLHFILHGWKEPEELVESVLEPLGLL